MTANDDRPPVWHCLECFRVVSRFETTCRHCGRQYQPTRVERAITDVAFAALFAGCVTLAIVAWAFLIA